MRLFFCPQNDREMWLDFVIRTVIPLYWAPQKNLVKGCRGTLDCYYVCCELLSASIVDALLFVNILVSCIFHGHFAQ